MSPPRISPQMAGPLHDPGGSPEAEVCAFCEKPIAGAPRVLVQVLFDGVRGNIIQKRPGKRLAFHQICELPPELEPTPTNG